MENSPEKSSDYVKRVLFGGSGGASKATGNERQAGLNRSESHSSTSSAPGSAIYSIPATPRGTTAGMGPPLRTPAKATTSSNAAVSVFLRVRPPGHATADVDRLSGRRTYQILEDQATLRTFPPLSAAHSRTINRQAKDFGFTRVFSATAGQEETYESTMRPLVDDVFSSCNALLFAYGMTNAGKTYTVLGEEGNPGLIPQALTDTFERVASLETDADNSGVSVDQGVRVEMSFLEIYNENVYDLLAAADLDDWAKARTALKLDDRMGVIQARDLSKHAITSASEGLDLVKRATANRRVASTKLNEDSSRSHSVCMIKLARERGKDSNLWVVDLAGSERSGRTGVGASSARQKEANNINKSLSTLWHCLTIMRSNLRKDEPETRVPFRESKLTHLFKNHLQGPAAGKTVMVVNINPSVEDFDETQQVLKNSTIARDVKTVRDASAATRQNGLINTPYGFNGRKVQLKKASRRSIHQPVAPKLDGLGPPPPRKTPSQSPPRAIDGQPGGSGASAPCDADQEEDQRVQGQAEEERDDGYVSGAESDSGLVDTRQSINLVVRNLQVDNEALKTRLKATLDGKRTSVARVGHGPLPGGPLERYISLLEDRVSASEARIEEMRQEHHVEVQELEAEFESFIDENGLGEGGQAAASGGTKADASLTTLARLQEEVRVGKLQADQWKKEAETLRARLEGIESRMSPPSSSSNGAGCSSASTSRSPLRQSIGSASQGRPSSENRQDAENSPPGKKTGPAPGGVGSPSKKASRNKSNSPRTKASALPIKKNVKKKSAAGSTSKPKVEKTAPSTAATDTSEDIPASKSAASSARVSAEKQQVAAASRGSIGAASGAGASESCESSLGGGVAGAHDEAGTEQAKSTVVIAVSRRVSVLRVSAAGGRRRSSTRASLAGGRRSSRASYAAPGAPGCRVSHLRSRVSNAAGLAEVVPEGEPALSARLSSGPSSRRESALLLAAQMEDNFFEKARRCMLRAMGLGARKSISGASGKGDTPGGGPVVPETAAEIEARHKIKVKMPKRPNKKAMEGVSVGPLWVAEHEGDETDDDGEDVIEEEVEEEEGPHNKVPSMVANGIERWVFGTKQIPTPSKAKRAQATTPGSSPAPPPGSGAKTIHDYVRAM